jgi:hypothetical protein
MVPRAIKSTNKLKVVLDKFCPQITADTVLQNGLWLHNVAKETEDLISLIHLFIRYKWTF